MDGAGTTMPLVLVVDDHAESREICTRLLELAGFRVATAINGLDAIVKAMSVRPHVIVMDLAMPHLDGLDCARQLASSSITREIPIVILTAHANPEARARAAEAGCAAFLVKPFDPPSLVAEVGRLAAGDPASALPLS